MAKISDIIEQFLLKTLGDEGEIDISRNELAAFFSCAPSQINYVLETRFTVDRGYITESQRGGGGYVKIVRIPLGEPSEKSILESVGTELSVRRMAHMSENLQKEGIVSVAEKRIIETALSDKALSMPINLREAVRANSFKNVLLLLLGGKGND